MTQTTQISWMALDSTATYAFIEAHVDASLQTGDISTDFKKALIAALGLSGGNYSLDDLWKRYILSTLVTTDTDVEGGPSRTPPEHTGQHPGHFLPPSRLKNADESGFPGAGDATVLSYLKFEGTLNSPGGGLADFVDQGGNYSLNDTFTVNCGVASGGPYAGGQYHDGSANANHSPAYQVADILNWEFGTGDFCFEFWMNKFGVWHIQESICGTVFGTEGYNIRVVASGGGGTLQFVHRVSSVETKYGTHSLSGNIGTGDTWAWIVIERHGNNLNFYVDGTLVETVDASGLNINNLNTGAAFRVGYGGAEAGYCDIADFRCSNASRYASAASIDVPTTYLA